MTADQIDKLFQDTIQIKGIEKDAGVSKQVIYNYRNRPTLSMGDKIEFLMKLDLIKVIKTNIFIKMENGSSLFIVNSQDDMRGLSNEFLKNNNVKLLSTESFEGQGEYKHILEFNPNEPTPKS